MTQNKVYIYPNPNSVRLVCDQASDQKLAEAIGKISVKRASNIDPLTPLTWKDVWQMFVPTSWDMLWWRYHYPNKYVVIWNVRKVGSKEPKYRGPFDSKPAAIDYELSALTRWLSDPACVLK